MQKAVLGGFYTRDQIHALEMGHLVFGVDALVTPRLRMARKLVLKEPIEKLNKSLVLRQRTQ